AQCALFALLLRAIFRKGQINLAQAAVFALFVYGHIALFTGVLQLPLTIIENETIRFGLYSSIGLLSIGGYLFMSVFGAIGFFGYRVGPILTAGLAFGLTYGLTLVLMLVAWIGTVVTTLDAKQVDVSLHGAVELGNTRIVEMLLADSADVNAARTETPLHTAVRHGQTDIARLLIDHGADLEARNGDGWTPLLLAIHLDSEPPARFLLDPGASLDATLPDGTHPLHAAAGHDTDLLRLLIEHGADVNAVREHRLATPLMIAA